MTQLEQTNRADATLLRQIKRIITKSEKSAEEHNFDSASDLFIAKKLTGVLEEAEEFFLDGDPEE